MVLRPRCTLVAILLALHLANATTINAARHSAVMMAANKKKKTKSKPAKAAKGGFGGGGFGASKQPKAVEIPSIELSTGAQIPVLGFGTYRTGGDELRQALDEAIAAGYRHIDTARVYQNEDVIGAAIAASGIPREDFFITTKLWGTDQGEDNARRAIQASLQDLGTSYIDCALIHGPDNNGNSAEEKVALRQQTWRVLEEQLEAGGVRAIGVSNFETRHIESVLEAGKVVPAINQIEMHAQLSQQELRAYCAARGIAVTAYGSVGAKGLRADAALQAIAQAHKRTPAQISLRHTLQRGAVVLAKSVTPKRVRENAQLFDFELSDEEVATLDALDSGTRSYWDNSDVP